MLLTSQRWLKQEDFFVKKILYKIKLVSDPEVLRSNPDLTRFRLSLVPIWKFCSSIFAKFSAFYPDSSLNYNGVLKNFHQSLRA